MSIIRIDVLEQVIRPAFKRREHKQGDHRIHHIVEIHIKFQPFTPNTGFRGVAHRLTKTFCLIDSVFFKNFAIAVARLSSQKVDKQNGKHDPFIRLKKNYHIRIMTIETFISPPILSMSELTSNFILGLWLMNLRGLRILSILTIFKKPRSWPARLISIIEKKTIKKSSLFQASRR